MIRINLANAKKITAMAPGAASPAEMAMSSDNSEIQRQGLIRLVIIALFPLVLYAYEMQNIPQLNATLQSKRQLLQALVEKNNKAKQAVEEIKKFKEDQARLQKQIDTLEGLRKDRLREVKILDNLQKDLPQRMWISRIAYTGAKMTISGQTIGDAELSTFMDSLSASVFFRQVNLIRSSDSPQSAGVQTKNFEVSCEIDQGFSAGQNSNMQRQGG